MRAHPSEADLCGEWELDEACQDVEGITMLKHPVVMLPVAGDEAMVDEMASAAFQHDWLSRKAALVVQSESLRRRMRQEKIWVDREGNEHKVSEIEAGYAHNIMRWLERRAEFMYQGACAWFLFALEPNGDMAQLAFEEEQNILFGMTALEWLHEQPLWRALDRRSKLAPDEMTRRRAVRSTLNGPYFRGRSTTAT